MEITPPSNPSKRIRRTPIIDSPETTDTNCFYSKLSECGTKPAILSITTPYAENYKPKSDLWFTYRAGRVTASKMKSVCHTDCANPSQS